MPDDELKQLIRNGLPTYSQRCDSLSQLASLHEDLTVIRNTFQEAVRDRSYSSSHPEGLIEISVDVNRLGKFIGGFESRFEETSTTLSRLADTSDEIKIGTLSAARGIWDANDKLQYATGLLSTLEGNTSVLSSMDRNVSDLVDLELGNLGINLAGLSLQVRTVEELGEINYCLEEIKDSIKDGFDDLYEGQEIIIENQEVIIDNLGILAEGQDVIIDNLEEIAGGIDRQTDLIRKIGNAMQYGFVTLAKGLEDVYLMQVHTATQILKRVAEVQISIQALDVSQERRHHVLIHTLEEIAKTEYGRRAQEKWTFAYEQFMAKNYGEAIREVRQALKEQSTHLPSLLLFARLNVHYMQWADAKDTYHVASNLARFQEDAEAYEAAVVGLARVGISVGNIKEAMKSLKEINHTWKGRFFPEAEDMHTRLFYNFLLHCEHPKPKGARRYLHDRLQHFAVMEHPEWQNLIRSSPYKEAIFCDPSEGPFRDIVESNLRLFFNSKSAFPLSWYDDESQVYANIPFTEYQQLCKYSLPLSNLIHKMSSPESGQELWDNIELVRGLFRINKKYHSLEQKLRKTPPSDPSAKFTYCTALYEEIGKVVGSMERIFGLVNPRISTY